MAEIKTLFAGEEHAALYKKYRPDMNSASVQKIVNFLSEKFNPSKCDAADVGCGSGQATLPLAPFLRHIVGLDPSEAQIKQIKAQDNLPDNVEFRLGEAENLPFENSSLQLVTVMAALHWFDIPKFFQEVDRVLEPGGVLAVSCMSGYALEHEGEAEDLFLSVARDYRTPEVDEKRRLSRSKFRDVKFPYDECSRQEFVVEAPNLTVANLMSTLRTRSDIARFIKDKPADAERALKRAEEKVMKMLGASGRPEDTIVEKQTVNHLILCRKPQYVAVER